MWAQAQEASSLEQLEIEGLKLLQRWAEQRTNVWLYVSAHGGVLSSAMHVRITNVGRCLVFKNEATVVRFDIRHARFGYGPLQMVITATNSGPAAAITSKPGGLIDQNGLLIVLEAGFTLFICERTPQLAERLEWLGAALEHDSGGLLDR
jgi:hypothetical protein